MDMLKQSIATKVPMSDLMQQAKVAETPEQQREGLSNQPEGTSMVFPESTGSFNTMNMDYPINIKKVNKQGSLVRSYENVPPGVGNLPMGEDEGTVIETPADYQMGGYNSETGEHDLTTPGFTRSARKNKKLQTALTEFRRNIGDQRDSMASKKYPVPSPAVGTISPEEKQSRQKEGITALQSQKEYVDELDNARLGQVGAIIDNPGPKYSEIVTKLNNLPTEDLTKLTNVATDIAKPFTGMNYVGALSHLVSGDFDLSKLKDIRVKAGISRDEVLDLIEVPEESSFTTKATTKILKTYLKTKEFQGGGFFKDPNKIVDRENHPEPKPEDKYSFPSLSDIETDVDEYLDGSMQVRIPRTKVEKDYSSVLGVMYEKEDKFDVYLDNKYGRERTNSMLSEVDRKKAFALDRERVAVRSSELSKQSDTDREFANDNADPLRHMYSSAATSKAISDKIKTIPYVGGAADYLGLDDVGGFVGANLLGAGHELAAFNHSGSEFFSKALESGKDMYNNLLGSYIGVTSDSEEETADKVRKVVKSGYATSGRVLSDPAVQYQKGGYENGFANMPAVDVIEKRDTPNTVIQNAQFAADNERDFDRRSKTWFPGKEEPSSFAGKLLSYVPNSVKEGVAAVQPYVEKAIEASGINQSAKIVNNIAGGSYDGSFKFHGGMPICYGNTCVQSTSELLKESGKWQGKLEQDNDAFAKNYSKHGYEVVQEENSKPGDIVQFYKGTQDNRDYSHMGITKGGGRYFNDGYFDKPWHEKDEPTTTDLIKNSKNPGNNKAIGKVYYKYIGK